MRLAAKTVKTVDARCCSVCLEVVKLSSAQCQFVRIVTVRIVTRPCTNLDQPTTLAALDHVQSFSPSALIYRTSELPRQTNKPTT